jgi:hypothetical protein
LCWALVKKAGMPASPEIGPAWKQVDQAGLDSPGPGAAPADLVSELAAAVDQTDWHALVTGMSDLAFVELLAESVASAMYWQPPDHVDRALAHPEVAALLRPVAHAVTGAPAARWWPSGIDLRAQQYIKPLGDDNDGPALSGAAGRLAAWRATADEQERSAATLPADPAAPYSGHWWSGPNWAGLVSTTRALPGFGPLQLAALEDWPGWTQVRCWPMTPSSEARIFEIAGPDDWVALVARYPLDVTKSRRHDWWRITRWDGAWLMPDYAAAASDYHALHLTVAGYLTTAGRALTVSDARCLLAGWSPDETYWLADVLTIGGSPSRFILDRSAQLGWRPA